MPASLGWSLLPNISMPQRTCLLTTMFKIKGLLDLCPSAGEQELESIQFTLLSLPPLTFFQLLQCSRTYHLYSASYVVTNT